MSMAYSKAAKRRARKLAGVDLAEVPRPKSRGGKRMRELSLDGHKGVMKAVIDARLRQSGMADTRENRKAVSAPHMGYKIGLVMNHAITGPGKRDKITKLWRTFDDWSAAESAYRRRYVGQSEYANNAALQMLPERFEADTSHTVDLRSDEEKDRAAINGWKHWQGLLGHLDRSMLVALHDARLERAELFKDQKPTPRGMYALESLKALHRIVAERAK